MLVLGRLIHFVIIGDLVESLASKAIKHVLELVDRESSDSRSPNSSSDPQGCQAQTGNGQSLLSVALRLLKREDGQRCGFIDNYEKLKLASVANICLESLVSRLFCNMTAAAVAAGTETYLKLRTSEDGCDGVWSRVISVISATEHREFVLECVSSITNSLVSLEFRIIVYTCFLNTCPRPFYFLCVNMLIFNGLSIMQNFTDLQMTQNPTIESLRENENDVGPELEYCKTAESNSSNYAFGQCSYSSDTRPKSPVCDPAYGHALACEHQVYTTSHCSGRIPIFNGVQSERILNTSNANSLRGLQSDTSHSRRYQWESAPSAVQVFHQSASQVGHPGVTSSVVKIVSVLSEKPAGRQLLVDITRNVVRDVTKSSYESLVQSGSQNFRRYSSVVLPGVFTTIAVAVLHAYTLALTTFQ